MGAAGVQVGTAFAYCEESGLDPTLKQRVLEMSRRGELEIFTDPLASPTGFPFKIVKMPGTLSEEMVYRERERICDLGLGWKDEDVLIGRLEQDEKSWVGDLPGHGHLLVIGRSPRRRPCTPGRPAGCRDEPRDSSRPG